MVQNLVHCRSVSPCQIDLYSHLVILAYSSDGHRLLVVWNSPFFRVSRPSITMMAMCFHMDFAVIQTSVDADDACVERCDPARVPLHANISQSERLRLAKHTVSDQ